MIGVSNKAPPAACVGNGECPTGELVCADRRATYPLSYSRDGVREGLDRQTVRIANHRHYKAFGPVHSHPEVASVVVGHRGHIGIEG